METNTPHTKIGMSRFIPIIVCFAIFFTSCARAPAGPSEEEIQQMWQEQYDLGMRHLADGNYSEAIIAFTVAIQIDEKHPDAFYGRGQAYFGAIDDDKISTLALPDEVLAAGQMADYCYTSALSDIERAIELNPEEPSYYDTVMTFAMKFGDIDTVIKFGKLKFETTNDENLRDLYNSAVTGYTLMDKLAAAFESGNDESVFALMQGEEYESLLNLQTYMKRPVLRDYNGGTLGIYRVNANQYGDCMIYYGQTQNGVRCGQGAWYGYSGGNNYASSGDWADDAPNGFFNTKEWHSGLNEDVVYRLVSGEVSNGLWNGGVTWAFDKGDSFQEWQCTFTNGMGDIVEQRSNDDGTTHYFWSTEMTDGTKQSLGPSNGPGELKGIAGYAP